MSHFIYTIGLPPKLGGELYQFDAGRSKVGGPDQPIGQIYLTRPLVFNNPISLAKTGTRFIKLIARQYDNYNNLLKIVEYNDVYVLQLIDGPDLILEFTYKP